MLILYIFQKDFWQLGSFAYHSILYCGGNEILATIIGLVVDVWHLLLMWGSYLINFHVNMAFMHTFKTAIEVMLSSSFRKSSKIVVGNHLSALGLYSKSGRLQDQMLIYSKLRILTTMYNNVFGALYVPSVKSCCAMVIVMSVFISIRLAPVSSPLVGIFGVLCTFLCTSGVTMFIMFMAMVNEYSVKFGKYLKRTPKNGSFERRLVRSFREEAVNSGQFYQIKRVTCLTVLGLISNMCGSALISFKI